MKRSIIILLLLLFLLAGCRAPAEDTTAPTEPPVPTTLMIYMVGSDLEARSGAATRDLEEIAASGVDLDVCNVVVMAGGSPYWHNEVVGENSCALLELTEDGFRLIEGRESVSMGEPTTLSEFLNYGYTNYPAERYALILWDHGNGPVMGYGVDELYDADSLLLTEMQQALADSPFQGSNKLTWVGFDACLMASAELACVWDDYAHYLVASQEIEPNFGWNYSSMRALGSADVRRFLTQLTAEYLENCEAYYESKGYEHRDTTLSCLDLSCTAELESALEALFSAAIADVSQNYNTLAVQRVRSRALGRATTGSEYDLVDLNDMAVQSSASYSKEAAQLQAVLSDMIVANATNAEGCCGLSLYYPFFNKSYYENSWRRIYTQLEVLPTYHKYLEAYESIWQKSDQDRLFASGVAPQAGGTGEYYLQLTEEQAAHFASARYRILERSSEDLYNCVYTSSDVTLQDNALTANFDGKVIFFKDKHGERAIPLTAHMDTVGDLSRYRLICLVKNTVAGTQAPPPGEEYAYEAAAFSVSYDRSTEDVYISSIVVSNSEERSVQDGKADEIDLSQWNCIGVPHIYYSWLTRDETGAVLPFDSWETQGAYSETMLFLPDEPRLVYEPLDGGEYYLMIEMQDTFGNYTASELLPIQLPEWEPEAYEAPVNEAQWTEGERVLLKEQKGVRVFLTAVAVEDHVEFTLELENSNDFGVHFSATDLICNGNIYCGARFGTGIAYAGSTVWFSYTEDLGSAQYSGDIPQLNSLSFDMTVRSILTGEALIDLEHFQVQISEDVASSFGAPVFPARDPLETYAGAHAPKQTIFSNDELQVTLLEFGAKAGDYNGSGILLVENLTNKAMYLKSDGIVINGQFISNYSFSGTVEIQPGRCVYLPMEISKYNLENNGITQIGQLTMPLLISDRYNWLYGFYDVYWCDITLDQKAENVSDSFVEGQRIIYEENGIRIAIDGATANYSTTEWRLTICNDSDYGISLEPIQAVINGGDSGFLYVYDCELGPRQHCTGQLKCSQKLETLESVSFRLQIHDFNGGKILFTDSAVIQLFPEP